MADESDYSKMSIAELNHCLRNFMTYAPQYKDALSELSKREITISQIPNLPDDVLIKRLSIPDVPDAKDKSFSPVNEAEKNAIAAELRRRETEKNIRAIQSDIQKLTKPHWTLTPTFWLVLAATLASLFPIYQYVSAKFQVPPAVENQAKSKVELQTTVSGTTKTSPPKHVPKKP